MEHERCYIYTPPETSERPAKRQCTSKPNPKEQPHLFERLAGYRDLWGAEEDKIQSTLEHADYATTERIVHFTATVADQEDRHALPTGLIVAGPSIASHGSFFARLGQRIRVCTGSAYVVLTSGESPNLKTLLKNLIRKVTSRAEDDDDDDLAPTRTSRAGPKVLDFDLEHVQEWLKKNPVKNVVVAIQDSEAFDAKILDEMIDLFSSWLDRIPFILLFGIATSAESFEDRLSGKTLRYLEGQKFDVAQSDEIIEELFSATIAGDRMVLRIGPNIARRIMDRQKDHIQNTQDFSDGLKYAYMSHFYANVATIFICPDTDPNDISHKAYEALRNLPSFRRWIETKVVKKETDEVRRLLDSDEFLYLKFFLEHTSGQIAFNHLSCAAHIISQIRTSLQTTPSIPFSELWIRAASAELLSSPLLRETMLLVKKTSSDRLTGLLKAVEESLWKYDDFDFRKKTEQFQKELEKLISSNPDPSTPLRSQHDVGTSNLRTTVVAQKVLLSKHKAALSEQDKAYSDLVSRFHAELEAYFERALIDPKELPFIELLMYDLTSPHTEVFQPKPRFAIERALSAPHDYLGCECCGDDGEEAGEGGLSSTQPATAILYQLYLESGALINVSDLWEAFNAMVGEEDEESRTRTMALFQRGLAELKNLGFVKASRKKTDHIAKTMWKGL